VAGFVIKIDYIGGVEWCAGATIVSCLVHNSHRAGATRGPGSHLTFLCGTIPPEPVKGGIVSLRSVREFPVKID
jgi:hypothetical protein